MKAEKTLGCDPGRRCQVAVSWSLQTNDAGLEFNMMELNTLSFSSSTEPKVGWTSELYFAEDEAAKEASPLTTVYDAVLNKKNIRVLVDCGASLNAVSESFVKAQKLENAAAAVKSLSVKLADGHRHTSGRMLKNAKLKLGCIKDTLNLHVLPIQQYNVILGVPWLQQKAAVPNWTTGDLAVLHNGRLKKIKSVTSAAKESEAVRRPEWLLSKKSFKKLLRQDANTWETCYMVSGEHLEELFMAEVQDGNSPSASIKSQFCTAPFDLFETKTRVFMFVWISIPFFRCWDDASRRSKKHIIPSHFLCTGIHIIILRVIRIKYTSASKNLKNSFSTGRKAARWPRNWHLNAGVSNSCKEKCILNICERLQQPARHQCCVDHKVDDRSGDS